MLTSRKMWAILTPLLLCVLIFATPLQATVLSLAQAASPIPQDVYAIARATTVLIGRDLSKGQVESVNESEDAGSGVIIARQTNDAVSLAQQDQGKIRSLYRYWVLTNAHVVDLNDTRYGIRTADGEVYPEGGVEEDDNVPQDKTFEHAPQIYRFGQKCAPSNATSAQDCFQGTDLAVLTFYSDREYPAVALAETSDAGPDPILVSGWPQPNANGKRVRISLAGQIKAVLPVGQLTGNYTLETTIRGKQGISGGPVLNRDGALIGIYGKGQGQGEAIGSSDNYGINIGQFIQLQSAIAPGEEKEYLAAFTPPAPRLTLTASRDPNVLTFAKRYEESGDNMTQEERNKLYLADLLPEDPRRGPIESLDRRYGCWSKLSDGTTGAGLQEKRGDFVQDLHTCLERTNELVAAATADLVTKEDLKEFQGKVESLAQRVAKLKRLSSTTNRSVVEGSSSN